MKHENFCPMELADGCPSMFVLIAWVMAQLVLEKAEPNHPGTSGLYLTAARPLSILEELSYPPPKH